MRIAVLTRYLNRDGRPWLTDDLIFALNNAGHKVDVFHYRQDDQRANFGSAEISTLEQPFARGKIRMLLAHALMLRRFGMELIRKRYDVVITFSAFGFFAPLLQLHKALRRGSTRHVGFLWDFYPVQRIEMGVSREGLLAKIIYRIENSCLRSMDTLAVMTERNAEYLRSYHPNLDLEVRTVGLWRDFRESWVAQEKTVEYFGLSPEKRYVVFGGSVNEGRNVGLLMEAALSMQESDPDVAFLLVGASDNTFLRDQILRNQLANLKAMDRLPMSEYLALLAHCDAGVVVTSADVESPSFPSKSLDYMWRELPIVAAVVESSDFGEIVEHGAKCGLACAPDNVQDFIEAVQRVLVDVESGNSMGRNGKAFLENSLSPDAILGKLCLLTT